ncbi:hypothetical protein OZN62_02710 [Aurantiacibacter sp. MUD11]|uniref:hypothetical protein n=1 Tax=Aurantiacibacter sp. MUD11 TaxID=3003265 RepID=UPI0022AA4A11|nr:hypothetical protein [Aurantiacibacter sp. MUD11]WAT18509.1 hypothetical protein OZN62_02710 [Aurantiacibacter sp. MUD11]
MLAASWPSPAGFDEYALTFDRQRERRLLVIPALFDEANKLRRFTVETMRRLDAAGIDTFLPDLPGTNESLDWPFEQDLAKWRAAMAGAAQHFGATHALSIRGGCLVATVDLPTAQYAPVSGAKILRGLLRAHLMQKREAGVHLKMEDELAEGRKEGLCMVGYDWSAQLIRDLEAADPPATDLAIAQPQLGGPGLWLRAEPSKDGKQSEALARIVQEWLV